MYPRLGKTGTDQKLRELRRASLTAQTRQTEAGLAAPRHHAAARGLAVRVSAAADVVAGGEVTERPGDPCLRGEIRRLRTTSSYEWLLWEMSYRMESWPL
jgi:hypothetical protein